MALIFLYLQWPAKLAAASEGDLELLHGTDRVPHATGKDDITPGGDLQRSLAPFQSQPVLIGQDFVASSYFGHVASNPFGGHR